MYYPYFYIPFVSNVYRSIRRNIRKIAYRGDAVHCIVCSKKFSKFMGHEDGVCPYCGSQTRQRLLAKILSSTLGENGSNIRTLFFAPDWAMERWLKERNNFLVTTADLYAPHVDLRLDITETGLDSATYQIVLCSHVLEHVPDDIKALREIKRLLRPDGILFLQVPIDLENAATDEDATVVDPQERHLRFGQFDHVRLYGQDLTERVESAGFSINSLFCRDVFDEVQMKKFGLWNDVLFICRPRLESNPN